MKAFAGLEEAIGVFQDMSTHCEIQIAAAGMQLTHALQNGNKALIIGNGGSAAEAQHIAAELVGRFRRERRAIAAIALTTDSSVLTAVSNDFGFEQVFERQVQALASPGDVLIALSTSGASPNILAAMRTARALRCVVLGITGMTGREFAGLCDVPIVVPSNNVARIQEASLVVCHLWCEIVEAAFVG